ncbi:MAG: rhomboid family intramembrane serine protease [Planctomycetales bacterium]|nr:rhomboid family intramembrane serine protease [Planctomycetales bacterium]
MGIYDRDYVRPPHEQYYSMGSGFKGLPPVVKWLLIINFAIFIVAYLMPALGEYLYAYGAVCPAGIGMMLQLWRVITYQFLHGGVWHLVFNLMVLYFMGPFVERQWGSKSFLKFYLICGAAGGVVYTLLVLFKALPAGMMVGASGGIYGVMAALAMMYPQMKVLLWGVIPMTMVRLVILLVIMSFITIAFGNNVGGEAAHLSGLAMGFLYLRYKPWAARFRMERSKDAWAKKINQERNFQSEVDRILDKVHREGIHTLSDREKQTLREATRREQENARPGRQGEN